MDLEKIVFDKPKPKKWKTILKYILIIVVIFVVAIVFVVMALQQLGKSLNNQEYKEIETILNKEYKTSDIVQFDLGALDKANLKNKLTSCMNADGLYEGDKLKTEVLFNNATLSSQVTLDKKDLTLIAREYITYCIGLETDDMAQVFDIQNIVFNTTENITNIRIVAKIGLSDLQALNFMDVGLLSFKGMPSYIYVTILGTIDNTKVMRKCLVSSGMIVNNLSNDDNETVLGCFLERYNADMTIAELSGTIIQYYLNSLHDILAIWNSRSEFLNDGIVLNTI